MVSAKAPETNDGVVTSWIPLTTAYPSVNGCSDLIWSYVPHTVAAWDPGYGLDVTDSACLPRPATTWWDQGRLGQNTDTVMSIGPITCPEAYFTAKVSTKDSSSTLIGCCPIGYKFTDFTGFGETNQCVSELKAGEIMTYAVRDESNQWGITTLKLASNTPIYGIAVNGWNFAQETASGSESSTACAATAATTVGLAAGSTDGADPGLTSGAKAGIGVGVAMGVIGLLSLLAGIWMMMRARQRERALRPPVSELDPGYSAGYGGWAVETGPMAKTEAVTTGAAPFAGDGFAASPPSGYGHYPSIPDGPSPSNVGGSTLGGTDPVELLEERPSELPARPHH